MLQKFLANQKNIFIILMNAKDESSDFRKIVEPCQ